MASLFDLAKDGTELTFSSDGINWIWYLKVGVVWPYGSMKVKILKHWRIHKADEGHPETAGRFNILENTARTACAVHMTLGELDHNFGDVYAAVENPKQVFDYGGDGRLPME